MAKAWHDMTALELDSGIGAGAIDPVALTDHFLDRIAADDADHAVCLRLTPDRARAEAEAARRGAKAGQRLGTLDGVPLSWKDLTDTAGVETSGAARAPKGRVPDHDAALPARATRAGTVCLGKTNLTEFAVSGLGINTTYGTPPIADLVDDEATYRHANRGTLHNATPGNPLKLCALTLPCGRDDMGLPAGLMAMQCANQEAAILRPGKAIETAIAGG